MGSTQERLLSQQSLFHSQDDGNGHGQGLGGRGEPRGRQVGRKKVGKGGGVKKPSLAGNGGRGRTSSTSARASSREGGSTGKGNMRNSKGKR